MSLSEIKKLINDLVNVRLTISKLSNNVLYKKDMLEYLDNAIANMKLQEKEEVYRLYLINERTK